MGKSCLMKRVLDNEFRTEHQVTVGVEFGSFGVKIDGKVVKLQIWDTVININQHFIGGVGIIQVSDTHILQGRTLCVPDL